MNYSTMVDILEVSSRETKNKHGQNIIIKPVPDNPGNAGFDPRVKAVRNTAKKVSMEPQASIEAMRRDMGWPNKDVSTGIQTQKVMVPGKGGDIPVRIYTPEQAADCPCYIFFHGGGFFGGTVDCVENPCKCAAMYGNMVVVSVDYRLVPEHPYPAGFEDCYDVVKWVKANALKLNVDGNKIGVGGDSAGGNLAVCCAQRDRDEGENIVKFAGVLYPALIVGSVPCEGYSWDIEEYNLPPGEEDGEKEASAELGEGAQELLVQIYLGGDINLVRHPYVSPMLAPQKEGLPPMLIIEAEYDFLRIQGEAYGRMLKRAKVPAKVMRYNGMDHAFMDKIGDYPQAEDAMNEIARHFLMALNGQCANW